MPVKKVSRPIIKKVASKKVTAEPVKPVPTKTVEVRVEVTTWISIREGDERSIEQFREDIKADLMNPNGQTKAERVTHMGGYYIVNGKVCLPEDYDPQTRGFKPGAHPPLWAMSADEREILKRIEKEKSLPALAQNPSNLRTAAETDRSHKMNGHKPRTPAEALRDLHENTEWGRQKKREAEEREREAQRTPQDADLEEFDEDDFDFGEDEEASDAAIIDDEFDDDDFDWDNEDVFNEDTADAGVEQVTSSALSRLKSKPKRVIRRGGR